MVVNFFMIKFIKFFCGFVLKEWYFDYIIFVGFDYFICLFMFMFVLKLIVLKVCDVLFSVGLYVYFLKGMFYLWCFCSNFIW